MIECSFKNKYLYLYLKKVVIFSMKNELNDTSPEMPFWGKTSFVYKLFFIWVTLWLILGYFFGLPQLTSPFDMLAQLLTLLPGIMLVSVGHVYGKILLKKKLLAQRRSAQTLGIISEHVVEQRDKDSDSAITVYRVGIKFIYQVNDQKFHGIDTPVMTWTNNKSRIEKVLSQYIIGEEVKVHYDPMHPQNASLLDFEASTQPDPGIPILDPHYGEPLCKYGMPLGTFLLATGIFLSIAQFLN